MHILHSKLTYIYVLRIFSIQNKVFFFCFEYFIGHWKRNLLPLSILLPFVEHLPSEKCGQLRLPWWNITNWIVQATGNLFVTVTGAEKANIMIGFWWGLCFADSYFLMVSSDMTEQQENKISSISSYKDVKIPSWGFHPHDLIPKDLSLVISQIPSPTPSLWEVGLHI